jgi:hypothetical protein
MNITVTNVNGVLEYNQIEANIMKAAVSGMEETSYQTDVLKSSMRISLFPCVTSHPPILDHQRTLTSHTTCMILTGYQIS